ncbi:MAG: ParB/RepB/Spo0J family partition protein [Succinivibrionaceae bacterium]|nr:ParB/RepB/Spo0J family partition protein [Succinivibrionaceae bacterium]
MSIDLRDLSSLSIDNTKSSGAMMISIDLIDEDPNQPRTIFNDESLNELAETIRERGVKSPISVRETSDGRYMINHGARRYRASKLAGKTTIPAFIDNDYTNIDQLIENIQRDNLAPMDIARFIESELNRGLKKIEIAKELGKSNSWVSERYALINLPECIRERFEQGYFVNDDVSAVTGLARLHKKAPEQVESFLENYEELNSISRKDVRELESIIKGSMEESENSNTIENVVNSSSQHEQEVSDSSEEKAGSEPPQEEIEELSNIDDLKGADSVLQDINNTFKTVKEIICKHDEYGSVKVVFRSAENDDFTVVLTDDGTKEVPSNSLRLVRVIY